ncbi:MAG: hypothetical protein Q9219_007527 [cf. Caloplaca sp. 3 TL-2023]
MSAFRYFLGSPLQRRPGGLRSPVAASLTGTDSLETRQTSTPIDNNDNVQISQGSPTSQSSPSIGTALDSALNTPLDIYNGSSVQEEESTGVEPKIDAEDHIKIAAADSTSLNQPSSGELLHQVQTRIPTDKIQSDKQSFKDIKLLEDRVTVVETQLRLLNSHPLEPASGPLREPAQKPNTTGEFSESLYHGATTDSIILPFPPSPRRLKLSIAHMDWDAFSSIENSAEYIIEVLGTEQENENMHRGDRNGGHAIEENKVEPTMFPMHDGSVRHKQSLLPELSGDLDLKLKGPLIMIRPFRLLITFDRAIRQRLSELESRWQNLNTLAAKEIVDQTNHTWNEGDGDDTLLPEDGRLIADDSAPNYELSECNQDSEPHLIQNKDNEVGTITATEASPIKEGPYTSPITGQPVDGVTQPNKATDTDENTDGPVAASGEPTCLVKNQDEDDELYDEADDDISSIDGKAALKRLRVLVRFLDEDIKGPLAEFKKTHQHQQVYFADLYHFFIPGEEVYQLHGPNLNDNIQAYRVLKVMDGKFTNLRRKPNNAANRLEAEISDEAGSPLVVTCVHLDFDGEKFGPITTSFKIHEYAGERSTKSLPIIPKAFIKDLEDLTGRLESRGRRFIELTQVAHKKYTGLTLNPVEDTDSHIIVDFKTTIQACPSWAPCLEIQSSNFSGTSPELNGKAIDRVNREGTWTLDDGSFDQIRMNDVISTNPVFRKDNPFLHNIPGTELSAADRQLLPGRCCGFVLKSRKWAELSVDLVKDLPAKQDGLDQLVLPDGYKDLIQALVEFHPQGNRSASGSAEKKDHQVDIVDGKGKGLIMLLYGASGVGKTSTAECVANHLQRPLFSITCGDLGETALSVQTNLEKIFQLTRQWGCVLLLDDADVFMSERNVFDVHRNSLVSVFLRALEYVFDSSSQLLGHIVDLHSYYPGILFLTTNRAGVIDPAFKSRIHISLYYPPLDDNSTIEIWKINIARLQASQKYEVDEDSILNFAKQQFLSTKEDDRWVPDSK